MSTTCFQGRCPKDACAEGKFCHQKLATLDALVINRDDVVQGTKVYSRSFIYDRQVIVAIAEELDPNRRKAALTSDRHRRIAALIHRWLSATLLDRLGILAVGRGCIRNHHIADGGMPTVVHLHMLDADKLLPAVRRRRRTSNCIVYAFIKRAAVDPKAAIRRSVPKPLSILTSTAIAAAWVQAI